MLFPPATLDAIEAGEVDLAFRRWERPRVRAGGSQRTSIGVIGFVSVDVVGREAIDHDAARRAGFYSPAGLLAFLDRKPAGEIHRVELRLVGPDPRVALRERRPSAGELTDIERRLDRLDRASRHGPWTRQVLRAIGEHPGERAADLAARFGRERLPFKADVRKLKELGLTESLERGYRLSPRGAAVIGAEGGGGASRTAPTRPHQRAGR